MPHYDVETAFLRRTASVRFFDVVKLVSSIVLTDVYYAFEIFLTAFSICSPENVVSPQYPGVFIMEARGWGMEF